jgi:hypothetical protein
MKNVYIIERSTGRIVAAIPIQMAGMSYTPSAQEYQAAAWEAAVDGGRVDPDRVSDYSFKIEDTPNV